MNPDILSWGAITPEWTTNSSVVHVFNHFLENEKAVLISNSFVRARLLFCKKHIPVNMKQQVIFDIRGQNITETIETLVVNELGQYCDSIEFKKD